jgi:hypothetical protein
MVTGLGVVVVVVVHEYELLETQIGVFWQTVVIVLPAFTPAAPGQPVLATKAVG